MRVKCQREAHSRLGRECIWGIVTGACLTSVGRVYWRSFLHPNEVLMRSIAPTTKWTPYEVKAAAILFERRAEDLQLEQLRIRLEKKIGEAETRESAPAAA
jgi:hypothetical protein